MNRPMSDGSPILVKASPKIAADEPAAQQLQPRIFCEDQQQINTETVSLLAEKVANEDPSMNGDPADWLIPLGSENEEEVARSRYPDLPFVDLDQVLDVPPEILGVFPKHIADWAKILPYGKCGDQILVATVWPDFTEGFLEIHSRIQWTLLPCMATNTAFVRALERFKWPDEVPNSTSNQTHPSRKQPEDPLAPMWCQATTHNLEHFQIELDTRVQQGSLSMETSIILIGLHQRLCSTIAIESGTLFVDGFDYNGGYFWEDCHRNLCNFKEFLNREIFRFSRNKYDINSLISPLNFKFESKRLAKFIALDRYSSSMLKSLSLKQSTWRDNKFWKNQDRIIKSLARNLPTPNKFEIEAAKFILSWQP